MTYDLRRLLRKGIIRREPGKNRYTLVPYERRVILSFTKLDVRVFRPMFASLSSEEPIPRPLAAALKEVDKELEHILDEAELSATAA